MLPGRPPASAPGVCTAFQLRSDPVCTGPRGLCSARRLGGGNQRAQYRHRVLTTARDRPISHKTPTWSPRQAERKHRPLTAGHWHSFESQPITPGGFCLLLLHPAGKARCKSYISGSSAKNCSTKHTDDDPRIPRSTGKQKKRSVPTLGRVLACPLCFFSWVEAVEVFMLNMGSRRVDPR